MTEITEYKERPRYSVGPIAFFVSLIGAPLVVTLLSFWTVIGLFALPFGIIPYLVIGTPLLLWAVGRIKPSFGRYALLGFIGNNVMVLLGALLVYAQVVDSIDADMLYFFGGFGLIFAPLYGGAFGSLYASLHTDIRILQHP